MSRTDTFLTVVKAGADTYVAKGLATIDQYIAALVFVYANQQSLTYFIETCDGLPPTGTTRLAASATDYLKYSFAGGPKPQILTFNGF